MNKTTTSYFAILIICILVSLFQHLEHFRTDFQGVHVWRQSQTMWNVRNFIRHDANILNPRVSHFNGDKSNIYRYEFPVMQWSIAMVQKVFGEQIELTRSLLFLIGVCSIIGIFFLVLFLTQSGFTALITAILFQYSPVFYYYTINPIPDNLALCGAIWYLYFMLKYFDANKLKYLILGSVSILIATLAKLPFLMYTIISIAYFIVTIVKQRKITKQNMVFAIVQLIIVFPALVWYYWVIPGWEGNPIVKGVFAEGILKMENLNIIGYNLVKIVPIKLLYPPVWILFFIGIYYFLKNKLKFNWIFYLIGITLLYLILESSAINRYHDYYLFPFLPWLFILVGLGVEKIKNYSPKMNYVLIAICLISSVFTYFATSRMWSLKQTNFNNDVFIYNEVLKNAVPDSSKCIILNDESYYIFSYQIDKMGYIFNNDYLPVAWVDDMVRNAGVEYMYSDSEKINNDLEIEKYIDKVILQKGSIKVMKLKIPTDDDQ